MKKIILFISLLYNIQTVAVEAKDAEQKSYNCCSCLQDCFEIIAFHMIDKGQLAGTPTQRVRRYIGAEEMPPQLTMNNPKTD